MNAIYMDTSALVKRYFAESGSSAVDALFRESAFIATATLAYAETYAALYRLQREAAVTTAMLESAKRAFELDWERLAIIDFIPEIRKTIPALLARFPLRGADAVHLASALYLASEKLCNAFVASDRRLVTAAREFGLKVIDPASA